MNELILYLLESGVVLGAFYLIYYGLLRKEASFNFNRFYLLGALLISFVLPLLSLDVPSFEAPAMNQPILQLSEMRSSYHETVQDWSLGTIDQDFSDESVAVEKMDERAGFKVLMFVYGIGLIAMVCRFFWSISWIINLRLNHPIEIVDGISVVKVPFQMAPFSFLQLVFVPVEMLGSDEFAHILEHEKTHIRQRHSIDLLIVQLLTAILWFNPVVWWLNKSLKTTHEYIADRHMIKQGYSLVEYQALLLRQLISNNSFVLVHNFNLSFIKKRITMMNIQKIGNLGRLKVAAVITMTVLFSLIILQCNSKLETQDLSLGEAAAVDLPVIQTEYAFNIKEDLRFDITIVGDQIYFKDKLVTLRELAAFDGNFPEKAQIVLKIDRDQKMKLVHEVQEVLREKDLRMVVYLGKGGSGELLSVPFLLPPLPNSKSGITLPVLTEEYVLEHNIRLHEVSMGKEYTDIFDSINNLLLDQSVDKAKLVVIGRFSDSDAFQNYLRGLIAIKQPYYDFYDRRAKELFGKSFYDINREREEGSEEAKQQYKDARRGVPLALNVERQ